MSDSNASYRSGAVIIAFILGLCTLVPALLYCLMSRVWVRSDGLDTRLLLVQDGIAQLQRQNAMLKAEVAQLQGRVVVLEAPSPGNASTRMGDVTGQVPAPVAPSLMLAARIDGVTALSHRPGMSEISGSVAGVEKPEQYRIVLYAKTDQWYVQPIDISPFTQICPDGKWSNESHPGTEYAALVVTTDYRPASILQALPTTGEGILAVVRRPSL